MVTRIWRPVPGTARSGVTRKNRPFLVVRFILLATVERLIRDAWARFLSAGRRGFLRRTHSDSPAATTVSVLSPCELLALIRSPAAIHERGDSGG